MLLNCGTGENSWDSLDCKDIQPANPKEVNPGYSLESLMLKLKLQYFGHLMWRTDFGKDPDAGKDWRWEEKGMIEDEMVGWHHWHDGQWVWIRSRSWYSVGIQTELNWSELKALGLHMYEVAWERKKDTNFSWNVESDLHRALKVK